MENGNSQLGYANERLIGEEGLKGRTKYGVPDNYNPADHPPVRLRNQSNIDRSETQRKRRSKNRLSNRRSTGYVSAEMVEEALNLGPNGVTEDKV